MQKNYIISHRLLQITVQIIDNAIHSQSPINAINSLMRELQKLPEAKCENECEKEKEHKEEHKEEIAK